MTEGDKGMLRRIFVACDTSPHSTPALLAATRLATELHAELDALFIEDVSLLRLAGLPFATEVDLHSGASRQLDTQVMERTMHYRAERVRQTLIRAAEHSPLQWSFRVSRGNFVKTLISEAKHADLLLIGRESITPNTLTIRKRLRVVVVIDEGTDSVERLVTVARRLCGDQDDQVAIFSTVGTQEATAVTRPGRLTQQIAPSVTQLVAALRSCQPQFVLLDKGSSFVRAKVFDFLLKQLPCPLVLVR